MYLLLSVHTMDDIPSRLYSDLSAALADRGNWSPAVSDCEFVGYKLVGFDSTGKPLDNIVDLPIMD